MAWEIQNDNGLALADIHFDQRGSVDNVTWEDNGIVYTDEDELNVDLDFVRCAGYNCEVIFINGANRVSA